jgi:anti-sigma factor RsiW
MNCDHYKLLVSAYIDNELPSDERLVLEKHLETCTSCAREEEKLRQLGELLENIPEGQPSPAFLQTTVSKAASIPQRSGWSERYLDPALSFVKSMAAFVFAPEGYSAGSKNLSSRGYLRTFDDSPPGSFTEVYIRVIQGGSQ